eukprot:c12028_g1_i3.p1 GENE.c12028_g1_i3~~c12028_g1_i3.p1  ORF type:complete len:848 (+),score=191.77 c12028_g1_i3:376-2544(+)
MALLDQAKAANNFNGPAVRGMREKVKIVHERRETVKALDKGCASWDLELLEASIARAQACTLAKAHPSVQAALKAIDRIKQETAIVGQLDAAMLSGVMVGRDLTSINAAPLTTAVGAAESFGMRTQRGLTLLSHCKLMIAVRTTMAAEDWQGLDRAIKAALQAGVATQELKDAKTELSHQAAVDSVVRALAEGIEDFDGPNLEVELEKAATLNMAAGEWADVVAQATELHGQITSARTLIMRGHSAVDDDLLRQGIAIADSYGCNNEEIQAARAAADNIAHLKAYARDAITRCQNHLLVQVQKAAISAGLASVEIQRVNALLALDTASFLKKEYEAAEAMNDAGRMTNVAVRIQDEFFKANPLAKFHMEACPLYKTRDDFAKAKVLGKKKRADGMFVWAKESNPAPMLRKVDADPLAVKTAKRMFKNMQGFMGDRKLADVNFLAQEFLDAGLETELLRDELYAIIVKQLHENPLPESEVKGWHLMQLCLQTFPPSAEFANYLEAAIRVGAKRTASAEPADFLKWLHEGIRVGPKKHQIDSIISKRRAADAAMAESSFYNSNPKMSIPATRARKPVPDITTQRTRAAPAKVAGAVAAGAARTAAAAAAAAPAAAAPAGKKAKALYVFEARDATELSIKPGDIITGVDNSAAACACCARQGRAAREEAQGARAVPGDGRGRWVPDVCGGRGHRCRVARAGRGGMVPGHVQRRHRPVPGELCRVL